MDSNNATPAPPSEAELTKIANSFQTTVAAIKIDSPSMFIIADQELTALQAKVNELDETRKSITKPMDEAKKKVMDLFRNPIDRCNEAISILKKSMLEYTSEEKRKAAEAQAKADEQVRQERIFLEAKARAEQAEAERLRHEAEAAGATVTEAEQAEFAALAVGDHTAAAEAATKAYEALTIQATAMSHVEDSTARAQLQQTCAATISAVQVRSAAPVIKGLSTSAIWTAEVTSLIDLVKYVAVHPEYINLLEANMTPIRQLAKSLGVNCRIPGIRAYQEERLTRRRA